MNKILIILIASTFLAACGGDDSPASSESGGATAASDIGTESRKSQDNRREPKWEIAIEGLPEKSGRIITAATMGGDGRYSLGTSGFLSSISLNANDPKSNMMFSFSEESVRCSSKGDATAVVDGDRAIVAGTVECMPGVSGEEFNAEINGWFTLDN